MTQRVHVGPDSDFEEGSRKIVEVEGKRVGVFKFRGGYLAYLNICLHQGGPVCEGQYFPRTTAEVGSGGELIAEGSDFDAPRLVCPWHGWEYDLATGEHVADKNYALKKYDVVVENGDVYVQY
ncbi:MAG: Rieske (2Fe-2S) protein [Actinobacteria bacterium]|nr:Rieske (2Fe-2S) protein [Actinomycetota bacterium]